MDELLTLHELGQKLKIGVDGLNPIVASPDFPAPIMLGERKRRWLSSDVDTWLRAQPRGPSPHVESAFYTMPGGAQIGVYRVREGE